MPYSPAPVSRQRCVLRCASSGLLTRLATTLAVTIGPALERAQKKGLVMLVVFAIQLCAYYSGFQYLDAVAASWKVTLKDPGAPGLHMLVAECLTVVAFAVLYIKIGGVISGIKTLPKEKVRTRGRPFVLLAFQTRVLRCAEFALGVAVALGCCFAGVCVWAATGR